MFQVVILVVLLISMAAQTEALWGATKLFGKVYNWVGEFVGFWRKVTGPDAEHPPRKY